MSNVKISLILGCLSLISCQQNQNSKDSIIRKRSNNENTVSDKVADTNSIRAYDKIYFGKINPYVKSKDEYFKFLWNYETKIANVKFYYWQPEERENSKYGLYKFALATTEVYDLIQAKKIYADLKSAIEIKYPDATTITFPDKESMGKINYPFNENTAENTKIHALNSSYGVYEYIWYNNNIEIQLGYNVEFNWVDKNNKILKLDGTDIRSKTIGQKKTYRPLLKFSNLKVINKKH